MFNKVTQVVPVRFTLSPSKTGEIARQASGAVLVTVDDTVVLATVVATKCQARPRLLPLTVDYVERTYAAGRIPGGFFARRQALRKETHLTPD